MSKQATTDELATHELEQMAHETLDETVEMETVADTTERWVSFSVVGPTELSQVLQFVTEFLAGNSAEATHGAPDFTRLHADVSVEAVNSQYVLRVEDIGFVDETGERFE